MSGERGAGRRVRWVVGLVIAVLTLVAGGVLFTMSRTGPVQLDPNPPRAQAVAPEVSRDSAPPEAGPPAAVSQGTAGTLVLDRIAVTAPIVDATVPDGVLTPPSDVSMVGQWVDGARLDSPSGTTLLAGHVNLSGQGNGALFNLALLREGDAVHTVDAHGRSTEWRVTRVVNRPKVDGIEESVLAGPDGPRRLAVVTCGGDLSFADGVGNYLDNVYLYADKVD